MFKNGLLRPTVTYCYYFRGRQAEIIPIFEDTVRMTNELGIHSVCCRARAEEMIRGCDDFGRQLSVEELMESGERISLMVTDRPSFVKVCRTLGIPVIFLFSHIYIIYKDGSSIVRRIPDAFSKILAADISAIIQGLHGQESLPPKPIQGSPNSYAPKKFEVPYNFVEYLIDYYKGVSEHVNYLYLPPFYGDTFNTRTCMQTKIKGKSYMPPTREEYEYHLSLIRKAGLRFVVLWQDRTNAISRDMLDYYTKIGACGFIVANDESAKAVKSYDPQLLVISSIVQRLCKGISQKDFSLYDSIVLFFPFTRSLAALNHLSHLKDKLILMPNSMCHTDCQALQHWFANDINDFLKKRDELCPARKDKTHSTFIHPEDLCCFDNYVSGYKIQGREFSTDYIITVCESFFRRKTLKGLIAAPLSTSIMEQKKECSLEDYYNKKTPELLDII